MKAEHFTKQSPFVIQIVHLFGRCFCDSAQFARQITMDDLFAFVSMTSSDPAARAPVCIIIMLQFILADVCKHSFLSVCGAAKLL